MFSIACLLVLLLPILLLFFGFCCICCFSFSALGAFVAFVAFSFALVAFVSFVAQNMFAQPFTITKAQQIASSISARQQEFYATRLNTLGKSNSPNKTVVDCEMDEQIR